MDMLIRAERVGDANAVAHINRDAFGRADEANLVDLLRKSAAYISELSLIAETGGQAIGHVLFTRIKIVDSFNQVFGSLALAPIAVLGSYQNKGVGTLLVKEGLLRARQLGFGSVVVLGSDTFYARFGFVPASQWHIVPPFEVPDDAFMAVELSRNSLRQVSGMVVYPKEFDIVG